MLKTELETAIERKISIDDYNMINTVYMYYPGFQDKEQVYKLYRQFGLQIFFFLYDKALEYQQTAHKLEAFPTCNLVREIEKRVGVTSIFVGPYDSFKLKKQMMEVNGEGPAVILVISD